MTPTQTHAALLTPEEIDDLSRTMVKGHKSVNWLCGAIEQALLAKLQPAQEPAQEPAQIPKDLHERATDIVKAGGKPASIAYDVCCAAIEHCKQEPAQAALQYVSDGHVKTAPEIEAANGNALRSMIEPAQAGELPDEREALIDDLAKWEMHVRRYDVKGACNPLANTLQQARAALAARKPLTEELRMMFKNIEGMLDAYVACIRQYGDYEVWHYIPEVEAHRDDLASYVSEAHGINGLEVKT